ncbi:glutathione S-transferase [Pectobacterium actinidiae]|uniref:Glutathione S-transferase n=1 Tax=Pectobacterium actinidiae TaxID=1507808 RepID=A0ABW8G906_9GAMM|nr:glutathione S-transferase [Pectobacterium actinidiae]MDY4315895.1 glutathione S-transferase [Pectobacterium actinidiae]WEF09739.1 glutathione S-transferase [Pectobacterium actinidiae]GKW15470.1 glutathione S-transferase [Pectobacterium carotovorum subsp. carotovorum]
MINVHHLEKSRSTRVTWLLEELGVDYEIIRYARDPKTFSAPASLKQIHPLGKSPVITDGELTIAESGAIVEYLIETYGNGRLRPQSGQALLDYRFWLHFAEGSLMPLLVMRLVLAKTESAPMPFFIRPIARKIVQSIEQAFIVPRLTTQLQFIEQHLTKQDWFAGESLSGADIQMAVPLVLAKTRLDFNRYPHIQQYIERIESQPAFQRAIAQD